MRKVFILFYFIFFSIEIHPIFKLPVIKSSHQLESTNGFSLSRVSYSRVVCPEISRKFFTSHTPLLTISYSFCNLLWRARCGVWIIEWSILSWIDRFSSVNDRIGLFYLTCWFSVCLFGLSNFMLLYKTSSSIQGELFEEAPYKNAN